MGRILQRRLGTTHRFAPGEEVALAVAVAAGDIGKVVGQVLQASDLTPGRYNVLRILRGAGTEGLPHAAIGARLLLPAPDVTRLVDPLVKAGWVRRVRPRSDRRVVLHSLTRRGEAKLARLEPPLAAVHDALVAVLGDRGARQLVTCCETIIAAVESGAIAPLPPPFPKRPARETRR